MSATLYLAPDRWNELRHPIARAWREDIAAWFEEVGFRPQVIDYTDVVVLCFRNDNDMMLFKLRWM